MTWESNREHVGSDDGNCYCKHCVVTRAQEKKDDRENFIKFSRSIRQKKVSDWSRPID